MKVNVKSNTFKLVFSALMIALATVLSLSPFKMPFGGSITLASMVPLVLVAQFYGFSWSLLTCSAYGIIQLILGLGDLKGLTLWATIGSVALDFVVAFAVVSLAAVTKGDKLTAGRAALGAFIGTFARFVIHYISGVILWTSVDSVTWLPEWLQSNWFVADGRWVWGYSLLYNGLYMIPEIILTVAVSAILFGLVKFDKLFKTAEI
ncbi:MAG: energy-coupled thiamine transporter ThiT [Oscillospiraceae bacterium]|jgi:thiamine transporter|nr:energy-coupled thiamine transporter ThiT [Oscillospiraceae bacterium]